MGYAVGAGTSLIMGPFAHKYANVKALEQSVTTLVFTYLDVNGELLQNAYGLVLETVRFVLALPCACARRLLD